MKNPRQKKARILEEKNALHVFCNLCRRSRRRLHADVRVRFAQSAVVSPYVLKCFLFFFFLPRFIVVVVVVCNRFPRSLSLSSLSLSLLTKVSEHTNRTSNPRRFRRRRRVHRRVVGPKRAKFTKRSRRVGAR